MALGREVAYCQCGDHAFSPVGKGFVALVSPQDADTLKWGWWVERRGEYVKVKRSVQRNGVKHKLSLAREILALDGDCVADHISGNTLDNRRANLRAATYAGNAQNRRPTRGRALPKGVRVCGASFYASIAADNRRFHLGAFTTSDEAAEAYEVAAALYHGDYRRGSAA